MSEQVIGVACVYTLYLIVHGSTPCNLQYLLELELYSTHFAEEEAEAQKEKTFTFYLQFDAFSMVPAAR